MKRIYLIALTILFISGQKGWAEEDFSDVDGTTITIHNTSEMALLATNVKAGNNYSGYTFLLDTDLTYDGTENNYTAIGGAGTKYFSGTFDGQGHIIKGINIKATSAQGLFASANGATIKNLTLTESTIITTNNAYTGGIVGSVRGDDGITIENCHVTSSVTIQSGNNCGGIVGATDHGEINITGCTCSATVKGSGYVGGIIGKCGIENMVDTSTEVNISGCLYYGTSLEGSSEAGGIVGCFFTVSGLDFAYYSIVNLVDNFYTYPNASVQGAGMWRNTIDTSSRTFQNIDINGNKGAIRVRVVTAQADIDDMGSQRNDVDYSDVIAYYNKGVKYGDVFYSHVLALENNADNTDIINAYAGQTYDVKLRGRRLYKDGSWNTICLPFNLSDFEETIFETRYNIYEMSIFGDYYALDKNTGEPISDTKYRSGTRNIDGKNRLYLFFTNENLSFEAGRPYIVKWEKAADYGPTTADSYDIIDPIFENAVISSSEPSEVTSEDGSVTFKALYTPLSLNYEDRSILFVGAANMLYYPSGAGTVSLNPYRAYFQLNGVQMASDPDSGSDDDDFIPAGGGEVKAFLLDLEDSDETGIESVEQFARNKSSQAIYDLSGRRVTGGKLSKGIYIINGRKEVVK